MSDFLSYLNSADVDTLTKTPGITRSLAEGLIAARPFGWVEDCLKVRGMGKNLLARMESDFEAQKNALGERALVTVQEEAKPAPVEESRPKAESQEQKRESFGSRMGSALLNVFRAILRFLVLVIVISGVGAAIYFGVPYVRENYIMPLEQNSAHIKSLDADIAAIKKENASLQAQLDELSGRVGMLEKTIEAHSASLEKLAEMQVTLDANMQAGDQQLMLEFKRDLALTRSIEYLSRARLYLSQSNFGLARTDVEAARDLLAGIKADEPEFKAEALKQVMARLDLALGNLPNFPVIAVGDVDIALELLLDNLPEGLAEPTATPTAVMEATQPPTPTLVVDMTPTPTAVP